MEEEDRLLHIITEEVADTLGLDQDPDHIVLVGIDCCC